MILLWWLMPVPCQAIAFLAVLIAASALQTPMLPRERRAVVSADSASNDALITPSTRRTSLARIRAGPAVSRVEICTKKHCKKKGSLKLLKIFEALAPDDVEVLTADMSHTEHACFDECMMGPNVRVDGAGPKADGGPIVNGVRGAAGAAEVLGVDVPGGWELPTN